MAWCRPFPVPLLYLHIPFLSLFHCSSAQPPPNQPSSQLIHSRAYHPRSAEKGHHHILFSFKPCFVLCRRTLGCALVPVYHRRIHSVVNEVLIGVFLWVSRFCVLCGAGSYFWYVRRVDFYRLKISTKSTLNLSNYIQYTEINSRNHFASRRKIICGNLHQCLIAIVIYGVTVHWKYTYIYITRTKL